ncbi:MAG: hypothetical protein Q8N69_02910 [bacterium]|nr:hypothetical protein [bacterium]
MSKSRSTMVKIGAVPGLVRSIGQSEKIHVFVDLEQVEKIDRRTISLIAALRNLLFSRDCRLVICGANSIVEVVLKMHCPDLEFYPTIRRHYYAG